MKIYTITIMKFIVVKCIPVLSMFILLMGVSRYYGSNWKLLNKVRS
jgi:hypothetical protein